MGSSTRKKSSKKADFQKPKLKVGKARPKPTNFTDTSFKSKGISLAHQSLALTAPTPAAQFSHNLSLLTSRSDSQRRDALASLTHALHSVPSSSHIPALPPRLAPLLLDGSSSVRDQVLKLLRAITAPERKWKNDVEPFIESFSMYVRAGMTHLAAGIRETATHAWIWMLEVAGDESVSCPAGWIRNCKTLCVVLRWPVVPPSKGDTGGVEKKKNKGSKGGGWTDLSGVAGDGIAKAGKNAVALLHLLDLFLRAGLVKPPPVALDEGGKKWPWIMKHTEAHMLPTRPNAYGYLNLFGPKRDEENECYRDYSERRSVFRRLGCENAIANGLDSLKREGGEVGRLGGRITKMLKETMDGMEGA